MYNLTPITDANNIYQIVKAVNDQSDGLIFALLMFILFIVILVTFRHRDFRAVLLVDSFIMSVIGVLAFNLEFIGWHILILPLILFFASILIYKFVE